MSGRVVLKIQRGGYMTNHAGYIAVNWIFNRVTKLFLLPFVNCRMSETDVIQKTGSKVKC
jgi:hypothetical protein